MRPAALLVLVASQLAAKVVSLPEEVSCDDADVFGAVDAALTQHNSDATSGAQLLLYRVTAALLQDSEERTFRITYEVRHGDCSVQTGKNWKECGYQESAKQHPGECTATVKNQKKGEFVVIEQNCRISPAEEVVVETRVPCLGCFVPISTDSKDLELIMKHALQHFNNNSNHDYLFDLREVLKASRQVVNGWNYDLEYSIIQTNCLKKEEQQLTSKCEFLPQGDTHLCSDLIHEDPQMQIKTLSQICDLPTGKDPVSSVTQKISVNSPELKEPLRYSLDKYNSQNQNNFYFKMGNILHAESLVGSGTRYTIAFIIKETGCNKEKEKYSEDCKFKELGEVLNCTAHVFLVQEGTFHPVVHCQELKQMLMRRPPGFSPFRAAIDIAALKGITATSESQTSSMPEVEEQEAPGKGQGHSYGHGHGHQKARDHDFGHKPHPGLGLGHKRGHGYGHGHQREHPVHGHKLKPGHWKHGKKPKDKHRSSTNEYPDNPTHEDTPSSQIQEETQGPPPFHSPSQQGVPGTSSYLQDLDLLAPDPTDASPVPTTEEKEKAGKEEVQEEDWIPDIPVLPKSPLFTLVPDFPEPPVPKCPGRPWKSIDVINPTMKESQDDDFDLFDAIDFGKK